MATPDYVALARRYETEVRKRRTPACKWTRLACDRNARDLKRQKTRAFPFWFDETAARAICEAAEQFPHIKGPKARVIGQDDEGRHVWQKLRLEPWQCWVLTTLFGWKRVGSERRRFRTALVLVPRKNAKSTLAATVLLYMLTADGEIGADCFSAATSRDQAKVVAEIAWEMARRSPQFCEYFGVRIGAKTSRFIEVPETASKALPLSADAHTLDGLNVHCAIVDELHAHKTRHVWDVLETATGAREQPLIFGITTAGVDTGGICYEQLTYLQKVLEQVHQDETYFGINYTIDEGDDWRTVTAWKKANPNYGVSVFPDDLQRKANKAEASPAAINNFLTKHLDVWVKADTSWMPMDAWLACGRKTLSLDELTRFPCYIGIDLSEVRDIAALVALFLLPERRFAAIGRFYLPEDTITKSPIAQYPGWVHSGHLIATDGSATDYARIEDDIVAWCERLLVVRVCFDRALAAQMAQQLEKRLGPKPPVVVVKQGVDVLNPVMQSVMAAVVERRFQHAADPVFTWAASNIVVQTNHKGEIYPRKAGGKDSHNKIDPMSALFTAWSQAMLPGEDLASKYEREGLVTL